MPPFDASDLKILVVDADAPFRKLAESALSKRGFSVHLAQAGEEAIAKIYYEGPQIVLLEKSVSAAGDGGRRPRLPAECEYFPPNP